MALEKKQYFSQHVPAVLNKRKTFWYEASIVIFRFVFIQNFKMFCRREALHKCKKILSELDCF